MGGNPILATPHFMDKNIIWHDWWSLRERYQTQKERHSYFAIVKIMQLQLGCWSSQVGWGGFKQRTGVNYITGPHSFHWHFHDQEGSWSLEC